MASNGLAAFGDLQISGEFGWENNELHRRVYLEDPASQLVPLMQLLFGLPTAPVPQPFCSPFGSFYAHSVNWASEDKGSQQDTASEGVFSLLSVLPTIRGGIKLDITYRPLDVSNGFGPAPISEEGWDFSSQVMSLIGNNYGTNPSALTWASDGIPITNLSSIIKIIPKIEFTQRKIWMKLLPSSTIQNMIGGVNFTQLGIGAAGQGNISQWPAECVLLVGLPVVRRWRFDGVAVFELGIKLAINTYQDYCVDLGTTGPVSWNRLYRPGKGWDTVFIDNLKTLYPLVNLGLLNAL